MEMLLWYRPEEQQLARPSYAGGAGGAGAACCRWAAMLAACPPAECSGCPALALLHPEVSACKLSDIRPPPPAPPSAVDLTTGGSDLGGSVSAALAAASIVFRGQNDTAYATQLLDKSKEVGGWLMGSWVRTRGVSARWQGSHEPFNPAAEPFCKALSPPNTDTGPPLPPSPPPRCTTLRACSRAASPTATSTSPCSTTPPPTTTTSPGPRAGCTRPPSRWGA